MSKDLAMRFPSETPMEVYTPNNPPPGGGGIDSGVSISTDGTFAANSDLKVPTEKATKTYVDSLISSIVPGGSNKQIQFNDAGTLSGFGSWDKTNSIFALPAIQGTISTFNLSTTTLATQILLNYANAICVSPDGTKIALASYHYNSSVFIYDVTTSTLSAPVRLSTAIPESQIPMVFSDASDKLYVGNGKYIDEIDVATNVKTPHPFSSGDNFSVTSNFLFHSGFLYAPSYGSGIYKIDVSTFSVSAQIDGSTAAAQIYEIANTPSWSKIYCASPTGSGHVAAVIDVSSFTISTTIDLTHFNLNHVRVTPNGSWAFFTSDGGYLSKVSTSTDTLTTQISTGLGGIKWIEVDNTNVYAFLDNNNVDLFVISSMTAGSTFSIGAYPYGTFNHSGLVYIANNSTGSPSSKILINIPSGNGTSGSAIEANGDVRIGPLDRYYQGDSTLISNPLTSDLDMNLFNITNFGTIKDTSGVTVLDARDLYNSSGVTMMFFGNDDIQMFPPGIVNMGKLSINGTISDLSASGCLAIAGTVHVSNSLCVGGNTWGQYSLAVGSGTTGSSGNPTSGDQSFALNGTTLSYNSMAIHFSSETHNYATYAMREGKAYGWYSSADGYNTAAEGAYQTVQGMYNTSQGDRTNNSIGDDDLLWIFGNGTGTLQDSSNAIEMKRKGDILLNGLLESGKRNIANPAKLPTLTNFITFTLSGDPYFTADGTTRQFTVYAYDNVHAVFDAVGITGSLSDANDAQGYQVDLTWIPSTNANGYIIYDNNANQYVDVGLTPSFSLLGSTTMTPGAPTLTPTIAYTGDSANFPSPVKLSGLTADRILGIDSSNYIEALDTSTYPDLTELSYLKGVTSSIQAQLNSSLSIEGSDRATGQTAAKTLTAVTVGGTDTTYLVSANVNITTSTLFSFGVTCTYTDETNTSRVLNLSFSNLAGTFLQTITQVLGVGAYEGIPLQIRAKSGTTITIASAGTFTTVTYNIEERIISIN